MQISEFGPIQRRENESDRAVWRDGARGWSWGDWGDKKSEIRD
jgi:hypothetical protein